MIEDSNLGGNGMKTNDEALLKIKYNVLRTVSRLAFEGRLEEERDNIPFKLIPGPKAQFRCCVYKEREIIRQWRENVRVTNRATISFRSSLLHVRSVRSQDSL